MEKKETSLHFKQSKQNSEREWERMGERILAATRQELYLSMRYFYLALEQMAVRADRRIHWIGTDGNYLYYHPMAVARQYRRGSVLLNRAYLHSVFHAMFGHRYRWRGNHSEKEKALWNLAADIMVEEMIDGLPVEALQQVISPEREDFYHWLMKQTRVHSAERIFQVLEDNQKQRNLAQLEEIFHVDDHSLWYQDEQKDHSQQQDRQQKEKEQKRELWREQKTWEKLREKAQTEMETYARTVGIEHTRLYQELVLENREKTDYRDFLRKFATLREHPRLDLDAFDYGYYQYGMRLYGNMPLIEELEYREEPLIVELAVVIDTSGSCQKELVSRFLKETVSILESVSGAVEKGTGRLCCHILQCDNQVQDEMTVRSVAELEEKLLQINIVGRGGTDFRPAFSYVGEQKRNGAWKDLCGLLYFTDGYGIYPESRPDYETAFLFPESSLDVETGLPWRSEHFPIWAMHVEVEGL